MNLSPKANWPTIVIAAIIGALFIAKNRGLLTADQIVTILAIGGITSTPVLHRMDGPS